jgi:zinc/manganese transport system substrate-binding protein
VRVHLTGLLVAATLLVAGCGGAPAARSPSPTPSGTIRAIGAENQYADVIAQIGGQYVHAVAIQSDPNTDPHTFEASVSVASELATAQLVVVNGLGYDSWAQKLLAASPSAGRKVVDAQTLLGLPDSTPNPHLWYDPKTMPAVAKAVAADLSELQPAHAAYFQSNLAGFDASLQPWLQALAAFRAKYGGTPVAVTEPVGDYLLQAAGCTIATPFSFQAAVMNGTDPSPQDLTTQQNLLQQHRVKALLYNQQVTSTLTQSLLALASRQRIPVVGVYETMPAGYTYQSWMLAETRALERAVADSASTTKL